MTAAGIDGIHEAYREAKNRIAHALEREKAALASIVEFTGATLDLTRWSESLEESHRGNELALRASYEALAPEPRKDADLEPAPTAAGSRIPVRSESVQGPTGLYYYDQIAATLGPDVPPVALDELGQFEVLNFADGRRTVAEIRDAVSAELEPITLEAVTEYLELLARAGVVRFRE
jgi:hypothetical protein